MKIVKQVLKDYNAEQLGDSEDARFYTTTAIFQKGNTAHRSGVKKVDEKR